MPFGLENAAQAFQRLMDGIFCQLDFAFVYLDDILIASSSNDEHFDHLRQVLTSFLLTVLSSANPNAFFELPNSTI